MVNQMLAQDVDQVSETVGHKNVDHKNVDQQYVTFHLVEECFGLPMDVVLEIIRPPDTIDVPLTPGTLVGLANLRGSILPILDLRLVLGFESQAVNEATRVIIINMGTPIGFVVDRIHRVIEAVAKDIAQTSSLSSTVNSDLMTGVLKTVGDSPLIQLLDVNKIAENDFADLLSKDSLLGDVSTNTREEESIFEADEVEDSTQLVSFIINQQEYAFELGDVQEIVRVPDDIAKVPKTDEHIIGLIHLRERFLPLVSLRELFNMERTPRTEQHRILIVNVAGHGQKVNCIGLVVDQVREVLRVEESSLDDVPALLNLGGESDEISSVCRLNGGQRLISILKASALISHPSVKAALEENHILEGEAGVEQEQQIADAEEDDTVQLVIFHLSGQEYGVSIEYVQEITRLPEKLDKVPRTPDFVEGMANLRGTVLPVMDMRRRFELEKMQVNDRQRIVVLNVDGTRTGFIVDLVSEVLRISRREIERSPALSDDQARVMGEVVNLREAKRMIQVLSVDELLSDQEITAISSGAVA